MRNKLTVVIICLLSLATGYAQSTAEVKKQINEVKKKTGIYIYGEATAQTEQDARELAEEFLYDAINSWAASHKKLKGAESLIVNNKKDVMSALTTVRGNMYRCFVYVKKSDIQKADNVDIIENRPAVPPAQVEETAVYPDIIREIAGITEYAKLDARLKLGVQTGEIADYARDSFPGKPEEYYFVIYNQSGIIAAMLSPGASRTNIKTGEPDSTANYKGYKAIGFKIK